MPINPSSSWELSSLHSGSSELCKDITARVKGRTNHHAFLADVKDYSQSSVKHQQQSVAVNFTVNLSAVKLKLGIVVYAFNPSEDR